MVPRTHVAFKHISASSKYPQIMPPTFHIDIILPPRDEKAPVYMKNFPHTARGNS